MTYIEKLYKRYETSNEGITFERWLVNEVERLEAKNTSAGTLGKIIEGENICPVCKGEGMIIEEFSKQAPCCHRCDGEGRI